MKDSHGRLLYLSVLLTTAGPLFAGGLATPGQGARALGMAGAFTAIADDASAIFYNPAGMGQREGTALEVGVAALAPELRFTLPANGTAAAGATQTSSMHVLAPSLFLKHQWSSRFSTGLGLIAPYAREAEYEADVLHGFAAQRSQLVRTDLHAALAWQAHGNLALAAGVVFGRSDLERSIPAGPGLRINDRMDGTGTGASASLLWRVNDRLKAGLSWKSKMSVTHCGSRTSVLPGLSTSSDANASLHYPASLGLGIAFTLRNRLVLAIDVNWQGWSSMDQVTVHTGNGPALTTPLAGHNSRDFRIGVEYPLPSGWTLRAGYAWAEHAFPVTHVIPAQPDADGDEIGLGLGRAWRDWRIDLAWHHAVTRKTSTSANIFGYNGSYRMRQQLLGVTVAHRF